jgi:hypothetical protein
LKNAVAFYGSCHAREPRRQKGHRGSPAIGLPGAIGRAELPQRDGRVVRLIDPPRTRIDAT